MPSIDIDFDVYKELTMKRESEVVSYNDVIRKLLKMPCLKTANNSQPSSDLFVKGVQLPAGTELRKNFKGILYQAKIANRKILFNGKYYDSPSAAAVAVTKNNVNGWRFWEVKLPDASAWQILESLRRKKA